VIFLPPHLFDVARIAAVRDEQRINDEQRGRNGEEPARFICPPRFCVLRVLCVLRVFSKRDPNASCPVRGLPAADVG
jgi:hypothetical protein